MPDMEEMKTQERINEEIQRLYSKSLEVLPAGSEAGEDEKSEDSWCCICKE